MHWSHCMSRFDICLGHYLFYRDWYDGQADPWYARLCRIKRYLKNVQINSSDLTLEGYEGAREVYVNLCEKHNLETPEELRYED